MKKKIGLSLLVTVVIFISVFFYCQYKSVSNDNEIIEFYKSIQSQNLKSANNLKLRIIDTLDKEYYDSIKKSYLNDYNENGLLLYEILISNKWEDCNSSYQVFKILANLDENNKEKQIPNIDFLDLETKKLAIVYLKKASDKRCSEAMFVLGKYYMLGKYVEKNMVLGKALLKDAEDLSNGVLK